MKKAVISTGGKQYFVTEGEEIEIELIDPATPPVFEPLLVISGDSVKVGAPTVTGVKVTADIVNPIVSAEKVTAIRYKAKKRVNKRRGHRQKHTLIKITKIS